MLCWGCDALYINGVKCHEQGCSEAWRDEVRECKWCGSQFKPGSREQRFCDDSCAESYNL